MIKRIFSSFILIFLTFFAHSQSAKQKWVDSVFNQLSENEKIGQLFMIPFSASDEDEKTQRIQKDLMLGNAGNVLFTGGNPLKQVFLTNQLQSSAKVPLFVAMRASEGVGKLLDSTLVFPDPLALGAIESDSMIYRMAQEVARELKLLGVNMNIGPSGNLVDTTEHALSTALYGEDPVLVRQKLLLELRAMQTEGIFSCASNFPIQGITVTEVRKGVPSVQLFVDTVLTSPFKSLFKNKIEAVLPAAEEIPVFYQEKKASRKNKFSSAMMSSFFAGNWLQQRMNYNGLRVVDVRQLEEVAGKARIADAEMFAFKTGNHLIVTDNSPSSAIRKIKKLLKKEKQYQSLLNSSVRKVLEAKYDAGLNSRKTLSEDNVIAKLTPESARVLQQQLFNASVTVVRNENNQLPLKTIENKTIASVVVGDTSNTYQYFRLFDKYAQHKSFILNATDTARLREILTRYDVTVTAFTPTATADVVENFSPLLTRTMENKQLIVVSLANPYLKKHLADFRNSVAVFSNGVLSFAAVPQVIFGGIPSRGILPVQIGNLKPGSQQITPSLRRLSYSIPEDAAMSSRTLKKIESIANEAINNLATPGCHVFVARKGKVVYEKSFGYFTYQKKTPVTDSTIYDLASVTKVSATLQAIMFLYDRGMIDLYRKASYYLPELKNSNKKDFTVKDILTHQAGLWPFVPFYVQTMKDTSYLPGFYSKKSSVEYPRMVADKMFTYAAMPDSLWRWSIKGKIREKPLRTPFDFKYSDIGFYIMQHLAERLLNQPLEDFVSQNIYEPLGAYTTGYLPLLRFSTNRIAPTENDKTFRKTLLIGTVHDPGAAMHGGVAGHAGLFSTANDLGKLCQMLLQQGYYGGYQYYKPETVNLFTQQQYNPSYRGLGWAKAVPNDPNHVTSHYASPKTFGHTGYTGTCIWIDPEFDLVYIFLSNRVHPDVTTKLLSANIRSRIQDVIYQAIFDYCGSNNGTTSPEEKMTARKNNK